MVLIGGTKRRTIHHKRGGAESGAGHVHRRVHHHRRTGGATSGAGVHNRWIRHCLAYARKHGCSYAEAMIRGRATYRG